MTGSSREDSNLWKGNFAEDFSNHIAGTSQKLSTARDCSSTLFSDSTFVTPVTLCTCQLRCKVASLCLSSATLFVAIKCTPR